MIQFQPTVRIGYFNSAMQRVLELASIHGLRITKNVVVFSMNDLQHNPGSLHPLDCAVDLDVLGNDVNDLKALYEFLRVQLPPGYDVIFEGNHVHVEFDAHRPSATAAKTVPA
jgi:hypothetical protein